MQLQTELTEYGAELANKQFLVGVNKMDLYDEELQVEIEKVFKKNGQKVSFFSGVTKEGLVPLLEEVNLLLS